MSTSLLGIPSTNMRKHRLGFTMRFSLEKKGKKLDDKSIKCIIVGYDSHIKVCSLYDPTKHTTMIS
jgi:hypothetical protein